MLEDPARAADHEGSRPPRTGADGHAHGPPDTTPAPGPGARESPPEPSPRAPAPAARTTTAEAPADAPGDASTDAAAPTGPAAASGASDPTGPTRTDPAENSAATAPEPREPPRRSDATRAAILAAARERFAGDGYERATIRAIARDAAIDPSMVMRYFGNKAGLFAAASELDLRLPDLDRVPRDAIGATLVRHFVRLWEGNETLAAVLRVAATNPAGAERMRTVFREQLGPAVRGVCPDPAQAPARGALVMSQVLGMALARYVLRLPPAVTLSEDEVVAWLGPTVQRYLTATEADVGASAGAGAPPPPPGGPGAPGGDGEHGPERGRRAE
ncbi:helix-turn-helix transcriptional regulator [Streptomyces sp. ventii]|uniref:Helix-turn-helix transcriptional regulator n=1 Tax=Streptomyces spiramenti TaxID=2720606 RepID=A0ABX1APJ9_9ACTN|nr:helix-turn-helix transcriptional regulator [Streptomyces spiramenti]